MTMFSCLSCHKIHKQKTAKRCDHFLKVPLEPRLVDSHDILEAMDLEKIVKLPKGADKLQWVAVNMPDFVNIVSVIYDALIDVCTDRSCPVMSACPIYHYRRKSFLRHPDRYSAVGYVQCLIAWVEGLIDSGFIYPTSKGATYPIDFVVISRMVFTSILYVYAHLYQKHFNDVRQLNLVAHLNTAFKHFVLFATEFELIDEADCEPLKAVIGHITGAEDEIRESESEELENSSQS